VTPRHAEDLLGALKQKPLTFDELYERVRLSGSAWTRDQLELFLLCAPGVQRDGSGAFQAPAASADDELAASIADAVRSFGGRPVPAAQVRARLPQHLVTTDEQVLAIVHRTAGLEVFGPNLIRIAR